MLLITGGVLRRNDPQPRRELPRVREPGEVADLGDQSERGDRRDPTEPGQKLHLGAPPLAAGDLRQSLPEDDVVPLGAVLPLAVFVFVTLVGGERERRYFNAARRNSPSSR